MSASRLTYLDSSAIVRLIVAEPESPALRRYLSRQKPHITSALAQTEVARALLHLGPQAVKRGRETLSRLDVVRINDRVLRIAGGLLPPEMRSLDAIHLATASLLGPALARVVTYDDRMAESAVALGMSVAAPA
jgi:predicted nucleic acid-binding protein